MTARSRLLRMGLASWWSANCGNRDQNEAVARRTCSYMEPEVLGIRDVPRDPRLGAASVGCGESLEMLLVWEEDMYYEPSKV